MYDPEKARQLLAEAGHAGGFDAGFYTCEVAYADLGEAALNYLGEVGIRAKLRPLANSLLLAAVAMAFWLLVGIPSGILAAVRVGRFWDSAGKMFALLGLSRHRVACHSPDRWRLFDDRRPLPAGSHPTLAARQRKLRDASRLVVEPARWQPDRSGGTQSAHQSMINRRFTIVPPALPSGGRTEQLGGQARNIRACSLKWRTWDKMRAAGFFELRLPEAFGGPALHPQDFPAVVEELSAADGSAGWCAMIWQLKSLRSFSEVGMTLSAPRVVGMRRSRTRRCFRRDAAGFRRIWSERLRSIGGQPN